MMNDDPIKGSVRNEATHPVENFNITNPDAVKSGIKKDPLKYYGIPTPDQNDLQESERTRPTSDSKPVKDKPIYSTSDSNSTEKNKKDIAVPEYAGNSVPKSNDQHESKPYSIDPKIKKVNQRTSTKDESVETNKRIKRQINTSDNNKSKFDSDLDREMIPDGIYCNNLNQITLYNSN